MKWMMFLAVVVAVAMLGVRGADAARAEGPTPPADATYALVQCSGMSISEVVTGERLFDDEVGRERNLTTTAMWEGTYVARVNAFAHRIGCTGDILEGDYSGTLTFSAKYYVPTFKAILFTNKFEQLGD